MKSLFRLPSEGELLWSAFARVCARFPDHSSRRWTRLLGSPVEQVVPLFPSDLQALAAAWGHRNKPDAEALLAANTLYPFVAPFAPAREAREVRERMFGRSQYLKWIRGWHRAIAMVQNSSLRFCPACVRADEQRIGVPVWRCCHQLGWLELCPEHGCRLVPTKVLRQHRGYVALEDVPEIGRAEPEPGASRLQQALAANVRAILRNRTWEIGPERLGQACLAEIKASGRSLHRTEGSRALADEIRRNFAAGELAACGAAIPDSGGWLLGLFGQRGTRLNLPHYAILCSTIGIDLGRLLNTARQLTVPESGPWRCISTGMTCSAQKVIMKWKLMPGNRASFVCEQCGTVYFRPLPLVTRADGSFDYEIARGSVLAARFAEFAAAWQDPKENWSSLEKRFGLSQGTLRYNAVRFDLPDMPGRKIAFVRARAKAREARGKKRALAVQAALRQWQKTHVGVSLAKLPPTLRRQLNWLRRYYPSLAPKTITPSPGRRGGRDVRIADPYVAQIIRERAEQARQELYQPGSARVSCNRLIGYFAPWAVIAHRALDRMPETATELAKLTETPAQFADRRAAGLVAGIDTAVALPSWSKFFLQSGLARMDATRRAQVRAAFDRRCGVPTPTTDRPAA
jgi:hypothetical protein